MIQYPLVSSTVTLIFLLLHLTHWFSNTPLDWIISNWMLMNPFSNWIHMHAMLDRARWGRGEDSQEGWGVRTMQKTQCDSKPYYVCFDDSSSPGINTAWLAPGHMAHDRKWISPNCPLWMNESRTVVMEKGWSEIEGLFRACVHMWKTNLSVGFCCSVWLWFFVFFRAVETQSTVVNMSPIYCSISLLQLASNTYSPFV